MAVGRWLKWFVPQPPGVASVFVRTINLSFVSETLTESVSFITELRGGRVGESDKASLGDRGAPET